MLFPFSFKIHRHHYLPSFFFLRFLRDLPVRDFSPSLFVFFFVSLAVQVYGPFQGAFTPILADFSHCFREFVESRTNVENLIGPVFPESYL